MSIIQKLPNQYRIVFNLYELDNHTHKEIAELLSALYSRCEWVPIYYLWRPNIADEGDNFLIELALAGNATHIVTNNIRDLKNAELKFPELNIVTPARLLRGE